MEAIDFLGICPKDVDLFLIDPPYYKIVKDSWDNRWSSPEAYLDWLRMHLRAARKHAHEKTSLLCFQAIGRPGEEVFPIDHIRTIAADAGWVWRNWITWKKRRAYGKSHDYLFCREEIFWFSASPGRTDVNFAIPLTSELRGYDGWKKPSVVGFFDGCFHGLHQDSACRCMSPDAQAQSKRAVHELLRQESLSLGPGASQAKASRLVRAEQRSSSRIPKGLGKEKSDQAGVGKRARKSQEDGYSIHLDGGRPKKDMDVGLPGFRDTSSNEWGAEERFSVDRPHQKFCWVCTWQHLRDVLEGKLVKGRFDSRRARSPCGVSQKSFFEEVALIGSIVKYPAKSKYKRVSNVWDDIPELMRPKRNCEKPIPLLERLISTHSNMGDLVVDFFAGTGSTGVAARQLGRNFLGCEAISKDAHLANARVRAAKKWPEENLTI